MGEGGQVTEMSPHFFYKLLNLALFWPQGGPGY